MITTSGCRPIAVGDATLRLVLKFEKREGLRCCCRMKAMQCSFLKTKMCLSVGVRAKQSECAEVASHTCDCGWRAGW